MPDAPRPLFVRTVPGYDTPNGTFKPNRVDADHLSQEWDNAPMPHTIFFDLHGHAVHGFFDVKHLGLAVSHGCVRLSPDHASTLFDPVKTEGMGNTTVVVSGQTPSSRSPEVAQRRAPIAPAAQTVATAPMQITPQYAPQPAPYYGQPAYGQGYYQRPSYGQGYYGQPAYQQPQYYLRGIERVSLGVASKRPKNGIAFSVCCYQICCRGLR